MMKHDLPIGKIIAQRRVAKGLSQKELAEISNVRQKYLNDIERGRKYPRINMLARIAIGLGVRIDELTRIDAKTDDRGM